MYSFFILFEIVLVAFVIYKQWQYFNETNQHIDAFINLIPASQHFGLVHYALAADVLKNVAPAEILKDLDHYDSLADAESQYVNVAILEKRTAQSPVFDKIRDSLNTYLLRNKGSVADFNLIKDITERNSNALEQDIHITLPTPLYLGLIGTMSGIVVGLGIFVSTVSFTDGTNTEGGQTVDYMAGISELLIGVCIGMLSSALGLALTVYNSVVRYKGAKSLVENRKNDFYTFIQTELLPILSQNLNTGFHNLQLNLMHFNNEFSNNLQDLKGMMSKNNEALIAQSRIVDSLEKVDINEFVRANLTVFSELKGSIDALRDFNKYINLLNTFVDRSNSLNEKVLQLLNRSDNLETLAQQVTTNLSDNKRLMLFLDTYFGALEGHGKLLNDSVGKIDNLMSKGFADLQENIKNNVHVLVDFSNRERDKLQEVMRENRTSLTNLQHLEGLNRNLSDLKKSMEENNRIFPKTLIELLTALNYQMKEMVEQQQQQKSNGLIGFVRDTVSETKALLSPNDISQYPRKNKQ